MSGWSIIALTPALQMLRNNRSTLLLSFYLGACSPAENEISDATINEWQALATEACICERESENKESCWAPYNLATAKFEKTGIGTASEPVSAGLECFGQEGEPPCVLVSYDVYPDQVDSKPQICTTADADLVDRAFSEAGGQNSHDFDEAAADRAVEGALDVIKSGIAAASPDSN